MSKYLTGIGFLLLWIASAAFGQQPVMQHYGPRPHWVADVSDNGDDHFSSAQEACIAQRQRYNPNATDKPIIYNSPITALCQWETNANSNTLLPGYTSARCDKGYQLFDNLSCIEQAALFNETQVGCDCGVGAGSPMAPARPTVGNPVLLNSGAKLDRIVDYASAEPRFKVEREYYSLSDDPFVSMVTPLPGFGARWHGVIPGRIYIKEPGAYNAYYVSSNGGYSLFVATDNNDPNTYSVKWSTQPTNHYILEGITKPEFSRPEYLYVKPAVPGGPAEFRMTKANGEYILFRRAGSKGLGTRRHLIPIEQGYPDGYKLLFTYIGDGEYPSQVSDNFNRIMKITWVNAENVQTTASEGMMTRMVIAMVELPDQTKLTYSYDDVINNNGVKIKDRLRSVKRISAAGVELWAQGYLYEDPRHPYALTGKANAQGSRLSTYSYDVAGLAASTELADGVDKWQIVNMDNADSKFWRYVTNPLGQRTDYLFQKYGQGYDLADKALVRVTRTADTGVLASEQSYRFQYDGNGRAVVTDVTNNDGVTSHFDLDNRFRPLNAIAASGSSTEQVVRRAWHPVLDLVTHEEQPGLSKDYVYSDGGLLQSASLTDTTSQSVPYSTAGQKRQWTYSWNGNGRLLSVNGPKAADLDGRDDVTSFAYDTSANLLTSTDAVGQVTTFANYDANGRPGKMTDPNGIDTLFSYDLIGRLSSFTVKHPTSATGDATTKFDYDPEGRVIGVTLPQTDKLVMDYDLAGRLTAVRGPSGEKIEYSYDAMSDVTAETVRRADATTARAITRSFDKLGRLVSQTMGTNRTTTWGYDKLDRVVSEKTARSNSTAYAFDGLSRLTSTVAPDTGQTASSYDVRDGVVAFTDAKAVTTTFVRNGFGDVISEVSPDRGTSTFYYDLAGDRIAEIDGRNQRVDLVRDALGRILKKTPAGKPAADTVTYVYDMAGITGSYGKGRLASVSDATGTTSFKYDLRGNLLVKQQKIGSSTAATLQYGYDLADRVVAMTYPSGRVVTYTRDSRGRINAIRTRPTATGTDVTLASGLTYEAFGSLLTATLGNGLTMAQGWGNDGRLASKRLYRTSGGTDLSRLTYGYDNDDNIISIADGVDASRSVTYGYDKVGRLAQSVASTGSVKRQDFLFDLNGNLTKTENRTNAGDTSPVSTATYATTSGKNRLASVTDASGTRSISYDGRVNTSAETRPGSVSVSVTYDGFGRLTGYTRTGSPALSHTYNGLDDRVSTAGTSGSTTDLRRFVYDADGRLLERFSGRSESEGIHTGALI